MTEIEKAILLLIANGYTVAKSGGAQAHTVTVDLPMTRDRARMLGSEMGQRLRTVARNG